jgi:hypothetical protein
MTSFHLTPVEKGIMRCKHTEEFSPEDIQALAAFFHDYHGKLLVDLTETKAEECARHIQQFRPMMPTAAIFGADVASELKKFPESYYTHNVQWFETEEEALTWLREQ